MSERLTDEQRCHLCGQRVRVAGGHEGTQYYVGVDEAELAEARALRKTLRKALITAKIALDVCANDYGKVPPGLSVVIGEVSAALVAIEEIAE